MSVSLDFAVVASFGTRTLYQDISIASTEGAFVSFQIRLKTTADDVFNDASFFSLSFLLMSLSSLLVMI